jgi:hypothetical protein
LNEKGRRLTKDGKDSHSLNLADTMRMYVTPTTQDARIGPNNIGGNKHRVKRGSIALADQILFPNNTKRKMYPTPRTGSGSRPNGKGGKVLEEEVMIEYGLRERGKTLKQMYPTPTVGCEEGGEQSSRVERTKSGGFILRKKNKPESTFGAKLSDAMLYLEKEMLPTPTNSEHKYRLKGDTQASKCLEAQARRRGGKLNPNFVEFLMGFPMNWTKTEPTESKPSVTQSSHKSQESSD